MGIFWLQCTPHKRGCSKYFHLDIPQTDKAADVLVSQLANWNRAFEITQETMKLLEKEIVE